MKERECSQGFKGGDFRPKGKILPALDWNGTTFSVRGKQKASPSCHGECGGSGASPVNEVKGLAPCGVLGQSPD